MIKVKVNCDKSIRNGDRVGNEKGPKQFRNINYMQKIFDHT